MGTTRKLLLPAVLLPAILLGGYLWLRPGVEAQVAAALEDVRRGLEEGETGRLVDRLDPAYDLERLWPRQARRLEAFAARVGLAGKDPHRTLRRVLALWSRQGRRRVRFPFAIDRVASRGAGRVEAVVTFGLTGEGLPFTFDPPVTRRFVLLRAGWLWPRLRFLEHEPLRP